MKPLHRFPLILNPKARSERATKAREFIMDHAAHFAIYASNSAAEAEELASQFAAEREPVVIAAGGDGTLNAIVKGLVGTQTALGILPTGTMNVFARELGLPLDELKKSLEIIKKGEISEIDLFEMNESPFIQMAGIGFDARVIAETSWEAKKALGPLAYLLAAVKVLGETPPEMTATFDGGHTEEGIAVLVGNGALYGGQLRLFGKADNADGLLDVIVFKQAGYRLVLETLAGISSGGFDAHMDSISYFQTKGLQVTSTREIPIELDGEYWGETKKAEFIKKAVMLKVLT